MKKILIFLFGIILTQTNVSTKHIPIYIDQNTSQIDFADFITFEDNGYYYVTLMFYENFINDCELTPDESSDEWVEWELEFKTSLSSETPNQSIEIDYEWLEGSHEYYFEIYNLVLSQNNTILISDYSDFFDLGCTQFSGTFYFQVTGIFEDDLIPSGTGDLNNDGIINVVDIVALVSMILGNGV